MSVYLSFVKRVAKRAGDELLKRQARFDRRKVRYKMHNEMVTAADKAAERIILAEIRRTFTGHSIISEESGLSKKDSEYTWIIDPLDGTSNFTMQNPLFGVSIALANNGELLLGVLYFPALKRLVWAETGKGAYCNGKRLRVSNTSSYKHAIHSFCHGKRTVDIARAIELYKVFLPRQYRLRHLGSAAFELSMLARGDTDTYTSVGDIHVWDLAAGVCVVREAGGTVTDHTGNEWNLTSKNLAASNGILQKRMLSFIQ